MATRGSSARTEQDDRTGIQSLETGMAVLSAFIGLEPTPMLKTIAERAGMPPAKAHRYLVSLCRSGYAVQDPETGRYRLGAEALRLGFAATAAIEVLGIIRPQLATLCQDFGQSVLVAVWGANGPTVALQQFLPAAVTISATIGGTLPMLRSSTGRTFGAWLPPATTAALVQKEMDWLRQHPATDSPSSPEGCEILFADVRKRGLARSAGQFNTALNGLSAPIFDIHGQLAAVVTVVGAVGTLDVSFTGPLALRLQQRAGELSRQLGHTGTAGLSRNG